MEKTIIALSGVGDCGKTETIRLAYDYLRQEGVLGNYEEKV